MTGHSIVLWLLKDPEYKVRPEGAEKLWLAECCADWLFCSFALKIACREQAPSHNDCVVRSKMQRIWE